MIIAGVLFVIVLGIQQLAKLLVNRWDFQTASGTTEGELLHMSTSLIVSDVTEMKHL